MLLEDIVLIGVPRYARDFRKPRGMVHSRGKEARDYRSLICNEARAPFPAQAGREIHPSSQPAAHFSSPTPAGTHLPLVENPMKSSISALRMSFLCLAALVFLAGC